MAPMTPDPFFTVNNRLKKLEERCDAQERVIHTLTVEVNQLKNDAGLARKKAKADIQSITSKVDNVMTRFASKA
jgi:uncharacterized coiled-coil protein SlyX